MRLRIWARSPALVKRYQRLVGALLFKSVVTGPDIAWAVAMLSRAMAWPTEALMADFFALRLAFYAKRKLHLSETLTKEWSKLDNKLSFVLAAFFLAGAFFAGPFFAGDGFAGDVTALASCASSTATRAASAS